MRALVTILAIIVVLAIIAVATGFVSLHGTRGSLPRVAVEGGRLPTVSADVGHIALETKKSTVDVPKVSVDTKKTSVDVPTLAVRKPQ